MEIGYIGLGKMGMNMVTRLRKKRYRVVVFDVSKAALGRARRKGAIRAGSLHELTSILKTPRLIWLMVPHNSVEKTLKELSPHLSQGDTVIDGGNSFFEDSRRRGAAYRKRGIHFVDVGVSGGPEGALKGASLMVGGERKIYDKYEKLFRDLSKPHGYGYMGSHGSGHFVKMVHNGIEYGMMQSIAEGFTLMKESPFRPGLKKVAGVYNHGSVVQSRLVELLERALMEFGEDLKGVSGRVDATGEGKWSVETAKKLKVRVPVMKAALDFRSRSKRKPSFTGKVLTALRNRFGGHPVH